MQGLFPLLNYSDNLSKSGRSAKEFIKQTDRGKEKV